MATEWARKILVRLTADDEAMLLDAQGPGEDAASCLRRLLREAGTSSRIVVFAQRKLPLFPTWLTQGPLTPEAAEARALAALAKGWEVELRPVGQAG